MSKFLILSALLLTGCGPAANSEAKQLETARSSAAVIPNASLKNAPQSDLEETLAPPRAVDCDENGAFFARLMKQGYERVVSGFDASDTPRDVAIWRAVSGTHSLQSDDDHLVLTVSGKTRACKIIGLYEMSAPAG